MLATVAGTLVALGAAGGPQLSAKAEIPSNGCPDGHREQLTSAAWHAGYADRVLSRWVVAAAGMRRSQPPLRSVATYR